MIISLGYSHLFFKINLLFEPVGESFENIVHSRFYSSELDFSFSRNENGVCQEQAFFV